MTYLPERLCFVAILIIIYIIFSLLHKKDKCYNREDLVYFYKYLLQMLYKCVHDMPRYMACTEITAVCTDSDKNVNLKVSRLLMIVRGIVTETRKVSGRKLTVSFAKFE